MKLVSFLLRTGLAVVFLYAAIASFLSPDSWVGFFPMWLRDVLPEAFLLTAFSLYECVLGLWLISGWRPIPAALLAAFTLLGVVIVNIGAFDIVFRDVALVGMALALAVLHKKPGTAT